MLQTISIWDLVAFGGEHPSDSNVDGVSDADIQSWNDTDASEHWSPDDAPAEETAEAMSPIGVLRYKQTLVLLAGKNSLIL